MQVLAALLAAAYLIPVYMTLVTSLKSPQEINLMTAWQPPSQVNWRATALPLSSSPVYQEQPHSSCLCHSHLRCHGFSQWICAEQILPSGRNVIMPLIVFGMFIPYQSILVPLFQFMQRTAVWGCRG